MMKKKKAGQVAEKGELTKEEIQKRAKALRREKEQRVLSTLKRRGYR
jgi:hypothetical protein